MSGLPSALVSAALSVIKMSCVRLFAVGLLGHGRDSNPRLYDRKSSHQHGSNKMHEKETNQQSNTL